MRNSAAGRDYIEPEMFQTVNIQSGTTGASTDGIGGRVSFKTKSPEDYLINGKNVAATAKAGYSSADEAWLSSVTGAVENDTLKALIAYAHRDGKEIQGNSDTKQFPADWKSDAILGRIIWDINQQHQLGFTADYYKRKMILVRWMVLPIQGSRMEMVHKTKILNANSTVWIIDLSQVTLVYSIS